MEEIHYCKSSPTKDQKIWRYIDFTKLVDLFQTHSLFFSRLKFLDDQFEGSRTEPTVRSLSNLGLSKAALENQPKFYEYYKGLFGVNCWHMNNYESAAMWNLYIKNREGVAI